MQNKFSKSIIYVACPRIGNAHSLHLHSNASPAVSLFFNWLLFSSRAATHGELKKLINPELSRHEGTDSIPNASLQEDKMCVKKYHQLAGIAEPRYAGSMCEGAFVSLISLMLLCVSHCSPWMSVTLCCPVKGNQHLE